MSDHYRLSWELVMAIGFAIFLILFAGPTGVRAIASFCADRAHPVEGAGPPVSQGL